MRPLKFRIPGPSIDWARLKQRLRPPSVGLGWLKIALDWKAVKDTILTPTVVLSFEEGAIRIVVIRGGRVVAWGTGKLPDESIEPILEDQDSEEQDSGSQDAAYVETLRSLLDEHGIRRCRVVSEVPLYASLLRHLKLPNIPRRYLDEVIRSEVVETIPFSKEEVDVTWQIQGDGDDQKVFATALRIEAIDSHVRLLEQAGIHPSATYPKAVALAFAAGKPDAIVVHITSSQADIVLIRERIPQVVNQLALPEEGEDSQKQAEAVVSAVEQMAGYYQDYQAFAATDTGESLPVVLAGEISEEGPLVEGIRQALQREVHHCAPPIQLPEHFPTSEYAVNLGLALASRVSSKRRISGDKAASTNLLPERYLPRPLPVVPVAIFAVLLVVGATAFSATDRVTDKESEADRLSTRVERMERLYRASRARAVASYKEAEGFRDLVARVDSRLGDFQHQLQSLVSLTETIVDTALPPNVNIPGLTPLGDDITVSGSALTYDDVLLYVENLRASGLFSRVLVQGVRGTGISGQESGEESVSFQLKLSAVSASDPESQAEN